jgi:hypothetical protein
MVIWNPAYLFVLDSAIVAARIGPGANTPLRDMSTTLATKAANSIE